MKKNNRFLFILGAFIVVALIVLVYNYILDTTGKLNQGNFRINDFVIKSTVGVEEKEVEQEGNLSDMAFDLSQNNTFAILVAKTEGSEAKEIYIDNVSVTMPEKKGELTLSQASKETSYDLSNLQEKIPIEKQEKDSQYYIELNINNKNFVTESKIAEGVNSVTYDGTILNIMNIKISEVKFEISFDLNIIDSLGKINKCKIDVTLPSDTIISKGISVERQSISSYNFIVE